MTRFLQRFVSLLLLALLPLQAAALPALILMCGGHDVSTHSAVLASGDTQHADHEHHAHDDPGAGGTTDHGFAGHGCCHFLLTAATPEPAVAVDLATPIYVPSAGTHAYAFFPDQPQRPPLATLV